MLSVERKFSQHFSLNAMRGIYNADFKVDVLPQAALRLHAVNYTQPLQGCITRSFLSILIPNSHIAVWLGCFQWVRGDYAAADIAVSAELVADVNNNFA